ncbi:recombinase family protein [Streptomyces sp. NBC_00378]|uniref:recombinase family protein n=1 Tax=unclassified Streptomyces TaxID=2593676 RepID=UPI002253F6EE|nr:MULTISPECIES: recombinase family protein [unclassified Streptomyces]MCX5108315.1 recombinase family protein [Streptomyces sp. NBC_00378]
MCAGCVTDRWRWRAAHQSRRQRLDLEDAGCIRIFEEKISGRISHDKRPELSKALDRMREGDMLCVQEVDRLGRNLLDGLLLMGHLGQQGIPLRVLKGIGADDHYPEEHAKHDPQADMMLKLAMLLAGERRKDISRKTKNGLDAARMSGKQLGRKRVMTETLTIQAAALRDKGFTIRQIQSHLRIADGKNKGKNPGVGAICQAFERP